MEKKILLTGAAGFIGSYLLGYLNAKGYTDIVITDDFSDEDKWFNFDSKQFLEKIEREKLFTWLEETGTHFDFVFHLGARTDTAEFDYAVHERLNVEYSKKIWNYCARRGIPLVYASSAATYGAGELGYKDDHELVEKLKPLNPYGVSKNEFDKWVMNIVREDTNHGDTNHGDTNHGTVPPFWAGLKFFNVYGPNEYHKGRMASMVFHGFNQVRKNGKVKLFRSHRPDFRDGEQLRDFIYVKDVAAVCCWMMEHQTLSGLYNLGTGKARTFTDLITAVFSSMGLRPDIEFIDIPEDIRDKYQYFTEADMSKLRQAGYTGEFTTLEEGVRDYLVNYLMLRKYY